METGFKEHLATGFVAVIILLILTFTFLPKPPAPAVIVSAVLAFMLGTLLPDVDAPFSVIRRTVNAVLFLILFLACLAVIFVYHVPMLRFCTSAVGSLDENTCSFALLFLTVAVPAAIVMVLDFLIPFHRGIMHGFIASFLYGALLSAVFTAVSVGRTDTLFIALGGMLGYVLHIVVDIIGDIMPVKQKGQ